MAERPSGVELPAKECSVLLPSSWHLSHFCILAWSVLSILSSCILLSPLPRGASSNSAFLASHFFIPAWSVLANLISCIPKSPLPRGASSNSAVLASHSAIPAWSVLAIRPSCILLSPLPRGASSNSAVLASHFAIPAWSVLAFCLLALPFRPSRVERPRIVVPCQVQPPDPKIPENEPSFFLL